MCRCLCSEDMQAGLPLKRILTYITYWGFENISYNFRTRLGSCHSPRCTKQSVDAALTPNVDTSEAAEDMSRGLI